MEWGLLALSPRLDKMNLAAKPIQPRSQEDGDESQTASKSIKQEFDQV